MKGQAGIRAAGRMQGSQLASQKTGLGSTGQTLDSHMGVQLGPGISGSHPRRPGALGVGKNPKTGPKSDANQGLKYLEVSWHESLQLISDFRLYTAGNQITIKNISSLTLSSLLEAINQASKLRKRTE